MYKNVWRGPKYKPIWNGEIDHITLPKNQFGMDNDYVVADIDISKTYFTLQKCALIFCLFFESKLFIFVMQCNIRSSLHIH